MSNHSLFIFSIIFLLLPLTSLSAQAELKWVKNFGGSDQDFATSIWQTTDDGYIVAGSSRSMDGDFEENNGLADIWVMKLDPNGNPEWQRNFSGSGWDAIESIKQTTGGGYIAAGWSDSNDGDVGGNNGNKDAWLLKLDPYGNLEWEKNFGGSEDDSVRSIQQTEDGGYIAAGKSYSTNGDVSGNNGSSDYWVIKVDPIGNLEWEKNFGGSALDFASTIQQTLDGGFIVTGRCDSTNGDITENNGSSDYWLVKLNSVGNLEWEKNFGGSSFEFASSILQTTDGGFIAAGWSGSDDGDVGENNGDFDSWILKLDPFGNLEWEKNFGGSDGDFAVSIQQTTDGGYIIANRSDSNDGDIGGNNGDYDSWILKLDSFGNLEWEKNFGGSGWDVIWSIQQTTDGGYICAGQADSNDGDVEENNGDLDFWIFKITPPLVSNHELIVDPNFNIWPNPSNGNFTIETEDSFYPISIEIFDAIGLSVYSKREIQSSLNINNIASGLYSIVITSEKNQYFERVIIH